MKQFSDDMNINDILAKAAADLTDEERAFLREHKDELTDEQKATFEPALKDEETPAAETEPEAEPAPEPEAEPETPVEASEKGTVKISAAEFAMLKQKADKGAQAFAELEGVKLGQRADKMIFSESNKEGHFLPKQKDALVGFLKTLSETQRDQFTNLISHLPKMSSKLFAEVGDGGKVTEATVFAEVDAKVKEARKADDKLTYSEALLKVFTENPELAVRYNEAEPEETPAE